MPRVPISGLHRGIFSKLDGPGPLGSGGHSHTSSSTGEFHGDEIQGLESYFYPAVNILSTWHPTIRTFSKFATRIKIKKFIQTTY